MVDEVNPMDVAKNVAKEISTEIKENHVSTLVYDLPTQIEFSGGKSTIPIFLILIGTQVNIGAACIPQQMELPPISHHLLILSIWE